MKDRRLGSAQGKRRYDLPLNKSVGTGFLVLLIALMTFLAVMAIGASFTLSSMTSRWSSGLENKLTIEIPAEKNNGELFTVSEIETLKKKTKERLGNNPEIKTLETLTKDDIQDLISPWLGRDTVIENIPLPGLISVELHLSTPEILQKLEKEMAMVDENIRIDTHESWLGDLLRLTGALQFAAAMVALIIGITTITAVGGAIRTRMAIHREDVELLHLMGASDDYITRQFQRHALIIALKGSIIGAAIGSMVLILIGLISGDTASALLPEFNFNTLHLLSFLILPGLACLIAALAARFTVLRVLAQMP